MADKEKLIRAMEYCTADITPVDENDECLGDVCPFKEGGYESGDCQENMIRAALALLKEQEPRVLTLKEVINAKDKTDVWLDEPDCVVVAATISNWVEQKNHAVTFFYGIKHTAFEERDYMNNNYNRTWRCWSARPSPEQMRDTPWEGEKE